MLYLFQERSGKCRGSQHLAAAVVLPSEEDSQTFTVNFATGEIFKVNIEQPFLGMSIIMDGTQGNMSSS